MKQPPNRYGGANTAAKNMISDILSDAVAEIDQWMNSEVGQECYQGDVRTRILILRAQMETMRIELDMPPAKRRNNENRT